MFNGGTGNDVHAVLYKSKSFEEQLEIALTATPKLIDAGRCNEKYFMNGVGIGFEGAVAKSLTGKKKTKTGKAAFMGTIFRKVFFYSSKKYKTISDEYKVESQSLLISVMNGHRAGGGFHIAPSSAIDDGLLDVVMVDKLHPFRRLRWLPVIEKGKHLELSFIKYFRTKKLVITSEQPMDTHLDGEYYSAKRLEIEMLPGKIFIQVLKPKRPALGETLFYDSITGYSLSSQVSLSHKKEFYCRVCSTNEVFYVLQPDFDHDKVAIDSFCKINCCVC